VAQLVPNNVPVVTGSEQDVLSRFVSVLDQYPAQNIVRVCADNPFVDPHLIDRLIHAADEHPECDYISYHSADGKPVILSSVGVYAEWCSAAALRRAAAETRDASDREHVTRFLYSHPDKFKVRLMPAPPALDRDDLRLTVDTEEDLEHVEAILEALGPDRLEWERIAGLLDHQPGLRQRMAELNQTYVKA
jgi:spore coat polysaccharide biosynthesis protein SpsF